MMIYDICNYKTGWFVILFFSSPKNQNSIRLVQYKLQDRLSRKKAAKQARDDINGVGLLHGDGHEAEEHLAGPRRQEAAALPASAGDVT